MSKIVKMMMFATLMHAMNVYGSMPSLDEMQLLHQARTVLFNEVMLEYYKRNPQARRATATGLRQFEIHDTGACTLYLPDGAQLHVSPERCQKGLTSAQWLRHLSEQ